jgi:hypothetical protein
MVSGKNKSKKGRIGPEKLQVTRGGKISFSKGGIWFSDQNINCLLFYEIILHGLTKRQEPRRLLLVFNMSYNYIR